MMGNMGRKGEPDAILEAVELVLRVTTNGVGKVFVVAGLGESPEGFLGIEHEAEEFHEDY